jgi:endo-1,4-beta-xylanase
VRRPWISLAIASVATLLGGQLAFTTSATAGAGAAQPSRGTDYPADSLRALAARVGLRIGTAVNPDLLGTNAAYTQITAEQFSSVTPENAMKWSEVEPTRGTYTWEKADKLVAFAKATPAAGAWPHARLAQPAPLLVVHRRLHHHAVQWRNCVRC